MDQHELNDRIDRLEEKRRQQQREQQREMTVEMSETSSLPPPSKATVARRAVREHGGSVGLAAGFLALATQIVPLLKPTISPDEAAAIRKEMQSWRDERTREFPKRMNEYTIMKCRDDQKEERDRQLLPDPQKQGSALPMRPYRDDCPSLPVPQAP